MMPLVDQPRIAVCGEERTRIMKLKPYSISVALRVWAQPHPLSSPRHFPLGLYLYLTSTPFHSSYLQLENLCYNKQSHGSNHRAFFCSAAVRDNSEDPINSTKAAICSENLFIHLEKKGLTYIRTDNVILMMFFLFASQKNRKHIQTYTIISSPAYKVSWKMMRVYVCG